MKNTTIDDVMAVLLGLGILALSLGAISAWCL